MSEDERKSRASSAYILLTLVRRPPRSPRPRPCGPTCFDSPLTSAHWQFKTRLPTFAQGRSLNPEIHIESVQAGSFLAESPMQKEKANYEHMKGCRPRLLSHSPRASRASPPVSRPAPTSPNLESIKMRVTQQRLLSPLPEADRANQPLPALESSTHDEGLGRLDSVSFMNQPYTIFGGLTCDFLHLLFSLVLSTPEQTPYPLK